MEQRGMKFHTGPNHATDLTDAQILMQCKMYIAALRIADDFGCDLIGIQYQQGLKDLHAGQRSGRRNLEQYASDRRSRAATANACCIEASRCRISTKWMNAPDSMP